MDGHNRLAYCRLKSYPFEVIEREFADREEVKAYIQLKAGVTPDRLTPAQIIEFCRSRLASYKIPRYVEYRADDFERTPSMKVQKQSLISGRADPITGAWDRETGGVR